MIGTAAELLSGHEEGRLAYAGATTGLPPSAGATVVIDIGGGSTELVMEHDGSIETVSLDVGCVRLTERFLTHDPPSRNDLAAAVLFIRDALARVDEAIPALRTPQESSRLVGLAGTVSTLVMLDRGLDEYRRDAVHHAVLTGESVQRWCSTLAGEPSAARAQRRGMVAGREDVVLGGALVLREAMTRYGFTHCLVSESDILDGLAQSLTDP